MKNELLFLISFLSLSFSAQSQDPDYSFKESFKIDEPFNLEISSDNSNIEVVAHGGNEIMVFYTVTKMGDVLKVNKEEMETMTEGQWKLDIQNTSKDLKMQVASTVKSGYINREDAINVHFKVYAPEQTSSKLTSSDGNLIVKGLALDQKCITNDGDIELNDLKGKVYAKTMDGDVFLSNVTGSVESITHDGKVIDLTNTKI